MIKKRITEQMKKNSLFKKKLKFEDFKGRWYAPCCGDDCFQILTKEGWDFAYNFDPPWALFETFATKKDLINHFGSCSDILKEHLEGSKK